MVNGTELMELIKDNEFADALRDEQARKRLITSLRRRSIFTSFLSCVLMLTSLLSCLFPNTRQISFPIFLVLGIMSWNVSLLCVIELRLLTFADAKNKSMTEPNQAL